MSHHTPNNQPAENPDIAEHSNRVRQLIAGVAATAIALASGAAIYKEQSGPDATHDSHSIIDTKAPPTLTILPTPSATEKAPLPTPSATEATKAPTKPKPTVPETNTNSGLKTVENLPGYGQKVTAGERAMMHASTVEVVAAGNINDATPSYRERCTGLKVVKGGETYVMTAFHCFGDTLYQSGAPGSQKPKNVTKSLSEKFGIWTIGSKGNELADQTAPVVSVSASVYPDAALLKINDKDPHSARFNKVPAVSLDGHLSKTAVPGAEATMWAMSSENGAVDEYQGDFLGEGFNPTDSSEKLYWVGMSESSPADACSYGQSGALAMIAGGEVTGPLSIFTSKNDDPALYATLSKDISKELSGLDISRYKTICGYGTATSANVQGLAQAN